MKKTKTKVNNRKKKEPILLKKPSKPKEPEALTPLSIDNDHSSVGPILLEEAQKLLDEISNEVSCDCCSVWKCTPPIHKEIVWDSSAVRKLADVLDYLENKLPGIEGTKVLVFNPYEAEEPSYTFFYSAKIYPDLEHVSKTKASYNRRLEKYEQKMEIYNSPASVEAREKIKKEAEKEKKLLEELKALRASKRRGR